MQHEYIAGEPGRIGQAVAGYPPLRQGSGLGQALADLTPEPKITKSFHDAEMKKWEERFNTLVDLVLKAQDMNSRLLDKVDALLKADHG